MGNIVKETNAEKIGTAVQKQRDFFLSGATLELNFRKDALRRLLEAVRKNESPIASALQADLGKSEFEAYACETGLLIAELRLHIAKMASWAKPKRAPISLLNFPAKGALWPEPYGSSLIIAPWNYPFLLALMPLIGAISAGCCAILKPSEFAPRSSELIETLLCEVFPPGHVLPISGAADTAKELLQHKFDFIFFTGGPAQGREVMAAAAKELTPVLLELGGKSPCIVGNDADISVAARRIAWGKFLNAGQTCVSPDYLLVQKEIREPFLGGLTRLAIRNIQES